MKTIDYIYATDTMCGVHKYIYETGERPVTGPVKYIHTTTGYGYKANTDTVDYVTPIGYTDYSGPADNELAGLLTAILLTTSPLIYTTNKAIIRAQRDWFSLWESNGYVRKDHTPIDNSELWKKVVSHLEHVKVVLISELDPGITKAKLLAKIHTTVTEVDTPYSRKYWVDPHLRDPLLSFNKLCFNEYQRKKGIYLVADTGSSIYDVGKRVNFVGYSVVRLNTPDAYIESLLDTVGQSITCDMFGFASMDRLFNKDVTRDIKRYGNIIYQPKQESYDHYFKGDDSLLIGEVKPTGLMTQGYTHFETLYNVLMWCDGGANGVESSGKSQILTIDVTSYIRTGNKPTDALPVGASHISLTHPVDHNRTHLFKLGKSLPNRNGLAAMARKGANFYLVYWKEGNSVTRYAIYITTTTGSAIYSNWHTDLIIS